MKIISDLESGLKDGISNGLKEVKHKGADVKAKAGDLKEKLAMPGMQQREVDVSEIQSGSPKSWPTQHAENPRKKRGFWYGKNCIPPWFVLVIPYFIVYYTIGWGIVLGIAGAALGLYLVLGSVCCLCWGRMYFWRFQPWHFKIDFYTKCLFLGYQDMFFRWKPPDTSSKSMPVDKIKPKGKLKKNVIAYAMNIAVPKGEEEEFEGQTLIVSDLARMWEQNLARLPQKDRFETFAEGEDPVPYVMTQLGQIYPRIYQDWPDKRSDMALTRFCLHGLAAHRVEATFEDGIKYYVVRTNALAGVPVRKGFARYGGDAYFDTAWRPVKIVDAGAEQAKDDGSNTVLVSRPGDATWEEAKFRFRSSVSVLVTVVDHLYWIHLQLTNLITTAAREHLSASHPMRRFLVPFCYFTIGVNDNANHNLVPPRAMAPRCFAWTDHGFGIAYSVAHLLVKDGCEVPPQDGGPFINRVQYTKWLKDKCGVDTEFHRQACRFWCIMRKFVVDYMNYYYPTHADVTSDQELMGMMRQFAFQLDNTPAFKAKCDPSGKPDKEAFDCIVDVLANHMFFATGMHEQYGAVEAYVQDVSFCAFKWVPGARVGTKQTATAQTLLMSFTSIPMPKLLGGDWTHLFPKPTNSPNPSAKTSQQAFSDFQDALQARSVEAEAYNAATTTRPFPECFPMYVWNPKIMESSVSV